MRRLLAVWLVGVLAAMMLGACGGGDDNADDVQAAASSAADDADGGDEADDQEDDADDDASDDDDSSSGNGPAGVFTAARCAEAIQAYSAGVASASMAMSGDSKAMKSSIAQMEKFADDAPREIRDEMQTVGDAWSAYAKGIADAGWSPASGKAPTEEQSKQLDEAAAIFEQTDYKDAQAKIDAWFDNGCSG
jgi:hypothetical protein